MIVDSYLEMYTTLYGWMWYNTIWDVLKDTGLLFLPFFGIILDHYLEYRKGFEDGDAEELTLRSLEVELVLAIFVAVFAGSPAIDLKANEVVYTPPAMYPGATTGLPTYLTTEQDKHPTDAVKDVTIGSDGFISYPGTVKVPVWWTWVFSLSNGVSKAIIENIPPTKGLRDYGTRLKSLVIEDPDLRKEAEDFMSDCFDKAVAKYRREQPQKETGAAGQTIRNALIKYGEDDPYWIGSRIYLTTSGYYDYYRSDRPHPSFAYDSNRDTEWKTAPANGYGRPYCKEWWSTANAGLKDRLLDQAGVIEKIQAWLEATFTSDLRHDALLKILIQNSSVKRSPRGYDLLYDSDYSDYSDSFVDLTKFGNRAFISLVGEWESFKQEAGAMVVKASSYQLQAIILMMIMAFTPFVLLLSKFNLKAMFTVGWAIFTVKFFTVIWFFVWWIDDNLLSATFFDNGGGVAGLFTNAQVYWNNSDKVALLNAIINMLYWLAPLVFMVISGWGGYHIIGGLGGFTSSIAGKMQAAGEKGAKVAAGAAKTLATKKV